MHLILEIKQGAQQPFPQERWEARAVITASQSILMGQWAVSTLDNVILDRRLVPDIPLLISIIG